MSEKVLVALSGGVDSSVAAAEIVRSGARAIAVTMRTFCYGNGAESRKSCCGLEGIADARAVAAELGIPHRVVDVAPLFERHVIDDFVAEYRAGRTPNPCVQCNARVKFPALWRRFQALGITAIATGHHARVVRRDGVPYLARGRDRAKDQSYVLWGVPPSLLDRVRFPVGELTKAEVRERARELGLPTAEKPESQEICFVPEGRHADFVGERAPEAMTPGEIVDDEGRVIGRHRGLAAYTVGQRKGLGIAAPAPLYVTRIDASTNRIHVGPLSHLEVERAVLRRVNFFDPDFPVGEPVGGLGAQLRAHQSPIPVTVERRGEEVELRFHRPPPAVAPGQGAVIYRGEVVVLGGVIWSVDRRGEAR